MGPDIRRKIRAFTATAVESAQGRPFLKLAVVRTCATIPPIWRQGYGKRHRV